MKTRDEEFAEARKKRFEEYEKWAREGAMKKASEGIAGDEIKLLKAENSKDLMVEVVINGSAKATLILDTGSYDIVLTRRMGEVLGIDFSDTKNKVKSIRLAGKERLAKVVDLDSIRIQDIEEKDLIADVLFEDVDVLGLKDGLLGLAYLDRFNCVIDLDRMKMRLQRKPK
ncbi:MAG: retropepsin-like domain-containing protein [Candidatus Omnitrophica bacterium]|nr:retropepsin-like domain-containing protein [Candidatus Omnitrophota bacterium]